MYKSYCINMWQVYIYCFQRNRLINIQFGKLRNAHKKNPGTKRVNKKEHRV